jgi:hypothetical protein
LTFGAVGTLLGGEVADGLEQATLAKLTGSEAVDAVLDLVDLVDTGDLGLVEVFCSGSALLPGRVRCDIRLAE